MKKSVARNIRGYFLHVNKVVIHLPSLLVSEESEMPEVLAQKRKQTKQMLVTELDLTKIDGIGDFPCPTCGVTISPEDESENVYVVLEEKVTDDVLEEMVIQCNKCSCRIRLTGFSALEIASSNPE
jgi:predicted RNA-binding Zn-ribbon protein involved in translation (DUF1610 family)